MVEELDKVFELFNINPDTTRSKATRTKNRLKKNSGKQICLCSTCFELFESLQDLSKHLQNDPTHVCKKSNVKEKFKKAKAEFEKEPDNFVRKHNSQMATLRLTSLEILNLN